MYLNLTNDDTASFYNNESMNAESKETPICFKFNPCYFPKDKDVSFCFVGDITDDQRSCFQRFGVDMDEDESKLQFYLMQNGDIGPCS